MGACIKSKEFGGKMLKNKKKKKESLPTPPSYVRLSSKDDHDDHHDDHVIHHDEGGTPKGHIPVMVGMEDDKLTRYFVPTRFMKDPSMVSLLQLSADEFGYQNQGVLQIPCYPQHFESILARLYKKR